MMTSWIGLAKSALNGDPWQSRYGRLSRLSGTHAPREFCLATGVGRSLFGTNGPLPDGERRYQPFRQMRSVLNRLGYTVRETQNLADIENPHAIAVFDVRPEEVEKLAQYPSDILTLVLWKDPISVPSNFEMKYHEPFRRIYTMAVTISSITNAISKSIFRTSAQ